MAAWVGRKHRGTTGVPWWKPISAAGNGSSVMRCARKPTSVKQPKWHSLSTSSTACWRSDARATSASYETTRTRDHCVHRLIHATGSRNAGHDALEVGERLADYQTLRSQPELANGVLMSADALLQDRDRLANFPLSLEKPQQQHGVAEVAEVDG